MQHGRTLHRKELEQAQVCGGMSPTGDLRRLQPQERQQRMRLVPPQTTLLRVHTRLRWIQGWLHLDRSVTHDK